MIVDGCAGVTIEKLTLVTSASEGDFQPAILLINSSSVTLQRCAGLRLGSAASTSAVVGLAGILTAIIRENTFAGPIGIGNVANGRRAAVLAAQNTPLLTLSLYVQDNLLLCSRRGISFVGVSPTRWKPVLRGISSTIAPKVASSLWDLSPPDLA